MFVLNAILFTVLSGHRTQTGNLIPTYQTHSNSELDANLDRIKVRIGVPSKVYPQWHNFTISTIFSTQMITLTPVYHCETNFAFNPNPNPKLGFGLQLG